MLFRSPLTSPSAEPLTGACTGIAWWNACTSKYAPRVAGSTGFAGYSIEIQGGPLSRTAVVGVAAMMAAAPTGTSAVMADHRTSERIETSSGVGVENANASETP